MTPMTYDEIFRTFIVGLIAATDILVSYWLGARVFEVHIAHLRELLERQ